MPSPAISTNVATTSESTVTRVGYPASRYLQYDKTHMLRHPQTVVNSKRDDGTYPPAAWSKDWYRIGCRPGSYTVAGPWSPTVPYYHIGGETPSMAFGTPPPGTQPGDEFVQSWWANSLDKALNYEWYVDNVARQRLLNKLSQTKMQLGVTLLELKQTAQFTEQLAVGVYQGITSLVNARRKFHNKTERFLRAWAKGGDPYKLIAQAAKKDISLLEDVRDAWMQYAFGLKPLMYDMHDAMSAYLEHAQGEKAAHLIRCKSGYTLPLGVERKFMMSNVVHYHVLLETTVGVHYSVVYEMPVGGIALDTLLGLQVAPTLWEVTKLSWMFDYVVGIGNLLTSLSGADGLLFKEGSKSVIMRQSLVNTDVDDRGWVKLSGKYGSFDYYDVGRFRRTVVPSYGVVPGVVPEVKRKLRLDQLGQAIFALTHWAGGNSAVR